MNALQALLLGILQGATEFVPVSSSGHLTLVPWFLGWSAPALVFDTTVHLGTLAAVLAFFWRDVWALLAAWWQSLRERRVATPEARVAWFLILATIPAALLGYLFEDQLALLFESPIIVAFFLAITGVILVVSERMGRQDHRCADMCWPEAAGIGLAQALAIAPGLSRSGATMGAGLALGLKRPEAARFSFLLSLPLILGTGLFKLLELVQGATESVAPLLLLLGFLAAALSGYLCIKLLLAYLQRRGLQVFAFYCWGLALLALVVYLARGGS